MEHRNTQDPLRALDRAVEPPPSLEARVRRTLVTRGLLRPSAPAAWRWLGAAAAAVLIFALGYFAGGTRPDAVAPAKGPARYVLLLYEDDTFDTARPEAELVAEYTAWAGGLNERGQLEAGEKLAAEGFLLHGQADSVVVASHSPLADTGVLTGMFIIRAATEAEALRIARTCPHLRYGGRVDVRPIEET